MGSVVPLEARESTRRVNRCITRDCVCLCHDTDHLPTGMVLECSSEGCAQYRS